MDILLVDIGSADKTEILRAVEEDRHHAEITNNGEPVIPQIERGNYDLIFIESRPGDDTGLRLLQEIGELKPSPLVVILSADKSITTAIRATRLGAFDYLEKPFTASELRKLLHKARMAISSETAPVRATGTTQELKSKTGGESPGYRFTSDDP